MRLQRCQVFDIDLDQFVRSGIKRGRPTERSWSCRPSRVGNSLVVWPVDLWVFPLIFSKIGRPASRCGWAYQPCWQHGYRNCVPYRPAPVCAETALFLQLPAPTHGSFECAGNSFHFVGSSWSAWQTTFLLVTRMLMNVFNDGPCDGDTVVGAVPRPNSSNKTKLLLERLFRISAASVIST